MGGVLAVLRQLQWFQIVSHLHPRPQRWISNCFEIAAPANHLITLALKPLGLGRTQQ